MRPAAFCASCHARIVWAVTETGKHMPLDETPAQGPTNLQAWRSGEQGLQCRPVDEHHPFDERTSHYAISHFATCPDAGRHRR